MIIDRPGRVSDRITLLGRRESCVYLLDGGCESALIGGGMSYIVPDILSQIREFGLEERTIRRIIIGHTHFDHVGIVPFLKARLPHAAVCASDRGKVMLARPDVIDSILKLNTFLLDKERPGSRHEDFGLPFQGIEVEQVLGDRQRIDVGDVTLEVLEVPGHSSCSIAMYCPEEKALFASDSAGIPFDGKVFCSANSNFDQYQASLERMSLCEVDFFCAEHYGVCTGSDAHTFMDRSRESARMTRSVIEESLLKTGNVTLAVKEVTDLFVQESSSYFLPREVIEMVVGQMTRYLAKSLNV
ncbi:MAG TPA: MBL fold metallo-hydrolase [Deltaproteobacteria bacterium]|nr:MBL fold metallo-hydrolase [Deltaproteobacteria bacterium]HXK46525.1 MBL fold metallo-hydrolase [Deltaproteobacteria bacterium]